MRKRATTLTILTVGSLAVAAVAWMTAPKATAHCQIPCGIYGDETRFNLLMEHAVTIERSMVQIAALSKDPTKNANQIARWVSNKEAHADEVAEIVTQYFLQQRVKAPKAKSGEEYDAYVKKLVLCHGILVSAMKCKQTTDLSNVESLRKATTDFKAAYIGKRAPAHSHR